MSKKHFGIAYSVFVLSVILLLWLLHSGGIIGVALILLLSGSIILRYRFAHYAWLPFACAVCVTFAAFYFPFWGFAAMLPISASIERRQFWLSPLQIAALVVITPSSLLPYLLACCAGAVVVGGILFAWERSEEYLRALSDKERAARLALERTKAELLSASQRASQLAEANERTRIARDIHDHAGHELTGVLLALQTVEKLIAADDPRAPEMLSQARERLGAAADSLRETVHNLKPAIGIGVDVLRAICERFSFCSCDFASYGDFSVVSSGYWELMESMLKEILTNVARHSNATKVNVRLDIAPAMLRLAAQDNGTLQPVRDRSGMGLISLRERCVAYGGHLSVDFKSGFMVVAVLPLDSRGSLNDDSYRR